MFFKCFIGFTGSLLSRKCLPSNLLNAQSHSTHFTKYLSTATLQLDPKKAQLVVQWDSNSVDRYPWVWLRDNCTCPSCFNKSAQSRTINFSDFKLDGQINNAKILGDSIQVSWKDGHTSNYDFGWLKERSFIEQKQKKWLLSTQPMYQTWNADGFKNLPVLNFKKVMEDDEALLRWLKILDVSGVCLLEGVPGTLGQVRKLATRVGFIKRTHYGEEFDVQAKADAANVAYTSGYLQLHVDLPYYEYCPGVNLLHCYIQYAGSGGDSLLADGFHVAEWLRKHELSTYKRLADTEVSWLDIGHEHGHKFHKIHHAPVICEHKSGRLKRINFSQPQRDSHLAIPLEEVEPWYQSLKRFYELALDSSNLVKFKLSPGQMISFNNLRVLHGRTGFGTDLKGERHVQGAYLDWDEIRSRIRVLEASLKS